MKLELIRLHIMNMYKACASLNKTRVLIFFTILTAFYIFSSQYVGPAYLSDEIGYLTKAIALAGYPVDQATSWHGGYSILIAPLFRILENPYLIWQGILFFNALCFAVSFVLLHVILENLFPLGNKKTILFGVVVAAIYPAWITMSGYSFSTPAIVLFYTAALLLLSKSNTSYYWSLYSLAVGFLYWLHPTGIVLCFASIIISSCVSYYYKNITWFAINSLIIITMILIYNMILHPWFNETMTPSGQAGYTHYKSAADIITNFLNIKFWIDWSVILSGQISYILISTFGLVVFAAIDLYKRITSILTNHAGSSEKMFNIFQLAFVFLSIFGVLFLGALGSSSSLSDKLRVDQWIYGRYAEPFIFPLIAIGVISFYKNKILFLIPIFLIFIGGVISAYTGQHNLNGINNLINTPAFWPQYIIPSQDFVIWFVVGACGLGVSLFLGKKYFPLFILPFFLLSINAQQEWHESILFNYSHPTSLVNFIRHNYQSGECIGIDNETPGNAMSERRNLYSFYLYEFDFRRMTVDAWSDKCHGPYLTQDLLNKELPNEVKVFARGYSNDIFLLINNEGWHNIDAKYLDDAEYYFSFSNEECVIRGCFKSTPSRLKGFSQVGMLKEGSLHSTGRPGYLFYGPYQEITDGEYSLIINMHVVAIGRVIVDIVSDAGQEEILEVELTDLLDDGRVVLDIPFSIDSAIDDLEIRMYVDEKSDISVEGYEVSIGERKK